LVFTFQYNLTSADAIRTNVDDAFRTAGFTSVRQSDGWSYVRLDDYGVVGWRVTPLPDLPAGNLVRGTLDLDLPAESVADEQQRGCRHLPDLAATTGGVR
jgi:hypothetical protein